LAHSDERGVASHKHSLLWLFRFLYPHVFPEKVFERAAYLYYDDAKYRVRHLPNSFFEMEPLSGKSDATVMVSVDNVFESPAVAREAGIWNPTAPPTPIRSPVTTPDPKHFGAGVSNSAPMRSEILEDYRSSHAEYTGTASTSTHTALPEPGHRSGNISWFSVLPVTR
jgi:hypothetical protein